MAISYRHVADCNRAESFRISPGRPRPSGDKDVTSVRRGSGSCRARTRGRHSGRADDAWDVTAVEDVSNLIDPPSLERLLISAMDIDRFHRDLEEAYGRLAQIRHGDDSSPPTEELLRELHTALEDLRVTQDDLLYEYGELQRTRGIDAQELWRYQTLFDTAPAAYVTTDVHGLITEVNGVAEHLFQRAADHLVGTPMSVLIDARDRRVFRLTVNRLAYRPGQHQLRLCLDTTPDQTTDGWASVSTGMAATGERELLWILQRTDPEHGQDMLAQTVKDLTTLFASAGDVHDVLTTLCERALEIVDAKASGVLLADGNGSLQMIAASDQSTELLELFEMEHAEGPCIKAFRTNSVIMIDDLDHHAETWPGFVRLARKRYLRSVLSVPMCVGSKAIGAFNLLHSRLIAFDESDVQIAETLAAFAAFGVSSGRALDHTQKKVEQLEQALESAHQRRLAGQRD